MHNDSHFVKLKMQTLEIVLNFPDKTLCKMNLGAVFNIYSINILFKNFLYIFLHKTKQNKNNAKY